MNKIYTKIKEWGGKEIMFLFIVAIVFSALLIVEKEIETEKTGVKAEPTFVEGTLVKASDDPAVYVITGGKRKHIPSVQIFESRGYAWNNIRTVSRQELEGVPEIKLIKTTGDPSLYYTDNSQKRILKSDEVLASYGLSREDAFTVEQEEIDAYPTARLLKRADDEKVFYITNTGTSRHIPSAQVFESYGNKWYNIVTVTHEDLVGYPINSAIKLRDTNKVYWLVAGKTTTKKHWVASADAFNRLGIRWDQIAPVNSVEFNTYPEGDPIRYDDIIVETPTAPSLSTDQQKIQDALSRGVATNSQSDILLKDSPDYQIFYIINSDVFLISILNSNFFGIRVTAENDLWNLLGVSYTTLCELNVQITTPRYVNASLAGQVYPVSTCP